MELWLTVGNGTHIMHMNSQMTDGIDDGSDLQGTREEMAMIKTSEEKTRRKRTDKERQTADNDRRRAIDDTERCVLTSKGSDFQEECKSWAPGVAEGYSTGPLHRWRSVDYTAAAYLG